MAGPVSHRRTLPGTSSPSYCALNLVIGYTYHGGENQQWQTIYIDGGWHIKSVGTDKYLNLEQQPKDDVRLIASQQPFLWHLWDDDVKKVPRAIRYGSTHFWMTVLVN
jgi:hypothetical protein